MIERRKDCDHGEKCLVIVILTIVANIPVYLENVVACTISTAIIPPTRIIIILLFRFRLVWNYSKKSPRRK